MALQINGIAINNTPFADGEAESLVQEIRRSLDREATAATMYRREDARRHRAVAENLYEQIQARVGKQLAGYARRFFPDDVGLQEDVLVEMLVRLRQRLLGDTSRSHYFEEYFNDAVKMLSIDAFRCIARENARSIKTGRPMREFMSLGLPPQKCGLS
jgi:hypothetical protein